MIPRPKTVKTPEDILATMDAFHAEAVSHPHEAKKLLRQTSYWVYDSVSGRFGPGKFVGFSKMNFETYAIKHVWGLQGGQTRDAIKRTLGRKFAADANLETLLEAWGDELLEPGVFDDIRKDKWKFIHIDPVDSANFRRDQQSLKRNDVANCAKTYLLAWNPKNWIWESQAKDAQRTADGKPFKIRWSLGNRKHIEKGDRLFLIRLGQEPKGIIGSGKATGRMETDKHYLEDRDAVYVHLAFDRLLDPTIDAPLDVMSISEGPLSEMHWATQSSGIVIPSDAAKLLEKLWAKHIGILDRSTAEILSDPDAETFPEGKTAFKLHKMRERNKDVIAKAKALAIKAKGKLACEVCEFDFAESYGKLGIGFIEGHHTRPLSEHDEERETKLSEIALVCSNCHRMLHRRRPWLTGEQLARLLK